MKFEVTEDWIQMLEFFKNNYFETFIESGKTLLFIHFVRAKENFWKIAIIFERYEKQLRLKSQGKLEHFGWEKFPIKQFVENMFYTTHSIQPYKRWERNFDMGT